MGTNREIIGVEPPLGLNTQGVDVMPSPIEAVAKALKQFETENDLHLIDWRERPAVEFIQLVQKIVPDRERTRGAGFLASRLSDSDDFRKAMHRESWLQHDKKFAGLPIAEENYPVLIGELGASHVVNAVADLDRLLHQFPFRLIFWQFLTVTEKGKVSVAKDAKNVITERYTHYATARQIDCMNAIDQLIENITAVEKKYGVPGFFQSSTTFDSATGNYLFNKTKLQGV